MGSCFQDFLQTKIDLAPLGVCHRQDNEPYFCTPEGAEIFGWAGVDGIHYCFLPEYGETVFAVSPMNDPGTYVHPVAADFRDFLRLLLSCGDAGALEQSWQWNEKQFQQFLKENPPTDAQKAPLSRIAQALNLAPMEQPFAYLQQLQASFDSSKLHFSPEYYEVTGLPAPENAPEDAPWQVYFSGSLFGKQEQDELPCEEIPLNRAFRWANRDWRLLALYRCKEGMVLDLCMSASAEALRSFAEKWRLRPGAEDVSCFSQKELRQIEQENPLQCSFIPALLLPNGQKCKSLHRGAVCWNAAFPKDAPEVLRAMQHYSLDEHQGWCIWRMVFSYTGQPLSPEELVLQMTAMPEEIEGDTFSFAKAGDFITFSHDGQEYILTALALEQETLPEECFPKDGMEYPRCIQTLTYSLSPNPPAQLHISLTDAQEGDKPRLLHISSENGENTCTNAACIGIIGGSDGATSIVLPGGEMEGKHRAASSLYFTPPAQTRWQVLLRERKWETKTVVLG